MRHPRRRLLRPALAASAATALALTGASAAWSAESSAHRPGTREILVVGNNHAGTADVIDPATFRRLFRLNVVPDLADRMREIQADPQKLAAFLLIRTQIGMGHDQLVDDIFPSPDGRFAYVSRPSFADVVGIDLRSQRIVWRTKVEGIRADHMALSPDGSRVLVSASTARKVHVIDTKDGRIVSNFASGDQPHESNYSEDGSRIFHASIGTVFTPLDDPAFDDAKGERILEIVDARSYRVLRRIDMRQKLDAFGRPDVSAAVRPMAVAPGERYLYLQLSFLHGFAEYDLQEDRVTRIADLPLSDASRGVPRTDYVLDSAHHGLAINPQGTKLCAAGTSSNYAAIVDRRTFRSTIIPVGGKPYWSTNSMDGTQCYVSVSDDDTVSVIDYATEKQIAKIPVGDHPQRIRIGRLAVSDVPATPTVQRIAPRSLVLTRRTARDARAPFRVRLAGVLRLATATPPDACSGTVRVDARRGTALVARRSVRVRRTGGRCVFALTLRVPARAAGAGGRRLRVSARFAGNAMLLPARSTGTTIRVG